VTAPTTRLDGEVVATIGRRLRADVEAIHQPMGSVDSA
jgi:hypothetical protein